MRKEQDIRRIDDENKVYFVVIRLIKIKKNL